MEREVWFAFYLAFNDDNELHAEIAFVSNGLSDVTEEELHTENLRWLAEVSQRIPNWREYAPSIIMDWYNRLQDWKSGIENAGNVKEDKI